MLSLMAKEIVALPARKRCIEITFRLIFLQFLFFLYLNEAATKSNQINIHAIKKSVLFFICN